MHGRSTTEGIIRYIQTDKVHTHVVWISTSVFWAIRQKRAASNVLKGTYQAPEISIGGVVGMLQIIGRYLLLSMLGWLIF